MTISASLTPLTLLRRHPVLFAAGLLALSAAGFFGVASTRSTAAEPSPSPTAHRVTVAPVEQRLVTDFEEFTVQVDATETVELRVPVSGHLESVSN